MEMHFNSLELRTVLYIYIYLFMLRLVVPRGTKPMSIILHCIYLLVLGH